MALSQAKLDTAQILVARHPAPEPAAGWADSARAAAQARLFEMGGPGRRDEYWKFTDPSVLTAPVSPVAPAAIPVAFQDVERLRIVFQDGIFAPDLSDDLTGSGIEILTLADALARDIDWPRNLFGVLETRGQTPVSRPLAALNTACATQGIAIQVNGPVARPVALEYLRTNDNADALLHHLIRVQKGQALTVLESGAAGARANICLEAEIEAGATLDHIRIQGPSDPAPMATHIFARLAEESTLRSFTLSQGGSVIRNEAIVEFTGDTAKAHVAGAAIGGGDFHHDDTVFVTHDGVGCESRQVYKKVLRDQAIAAFQGKILVKAGAQKTDGYQISQGLLLDESAQFLAKPELEIYADDVACSHGSTVGAVDADALFYLTSRGVPHATAQDMLVRAFLDEAIQEIADDALADAVRDLIIDRI